MQCRKALDHFLSSTKRKESTRKKYRYKLQEFLCMYGELELEQITAGHCSRWFAMLQDRGYSPANLSMYRSCLAALFNEYRPGHNPALTIPKPSDKPLRVVVPEAADVLKAAVTAKQLSTSDNEKNRRNAAVFALSVATGGRRCEIKNLTCTEVQTSFSKPLHSQEGIYYVLWTTGKTGTVKLVVSESIKQIVTSWLDVRPKTRHNRLFVTLQNDNRYGNPLKDRGMNQCIHRVCEVACVDRLSFQLLRRYKATVVAEKHGVEVAARVLNHRSGTYTLRNFYYDPDELQAATAAIDSTPI